MSYYKKTHQKYSRWLEEFRERFARPQPPEQTEAIDYREIKLSTQSTLFMAINQCQAAGVALPEKVIDIANQFNLYEHEVHPISGETPKVKALIKEFLEQSDSH